jgi:hypothetical protein
MNSRKERKKTQKGESLAASSLHWFVRNHIPTVAVKKRLVPFVLTALGFAMTASGCKHSLPHPPTFADFHRVGPGMLEDEKKINAQIVLFEAAFFSPQDIQTIRAKGTAREIIGAALQAKLGDPSVSLLIREALAQGSNDAVVVTGIANSLVRTIVNERQGPHDTPDLHQVLTALERLEPDNGFPQCLRAYLQLKQGDTYGARISVKAAAQKPALRLYGPELRQGVLQAALTANYPRYTASMLALGTLGGSAEIGNMGKRLLTDSRLDRATAEACLELGRRHEAQAKLFIDQLIAYSLQQQALEFLKPAGFEPEWERMQQAKEKIKRATAFLDSAKAHAASERHWLAYFDTLFEKSESEATEQFAQTLNYKL